MDTKMKRKIQEDGQTSKPQFLYLSLVHHDYQKKQTFR